MRFWIYIKKSGIYFCSAMNGGQRTKARHSTSNSREREVRMDPKKTRDSEAQQKRKSVIILSVITIAVTLLAVLG